jgi:hypothetical protein
MIEIANEECVCTKYSTSLNVCKNHYMVQENGKSIQLKPRNPQDKVKVIIIDNCVIKDARMRTDCLFLFERNAKHYSFLVELKGRHHLQHAFKQLSATKEYSEYREIISKMHNPINKYVIVSDIQLNAKEMQKLENEYGIRVGKIVHSEPNTPIPDLKDYI